MVKGYSTSLASVLKPLGRADVVNSSVLSQLLKDMEVLKPRVSPVLPVWDLGLVLGALQVAPFEPLIEVPWKYLTDKTAFLLATASGGRRSELQALMYGEKYCLFQPHGARATLYLTHLSCGKSEVQ